MSLTLTINKLHFPNNGIIDNPITVSLYYKEYYDIDFTLIGTGFNVDVDGTITDSPLPAVVIDPSLKYVLRAVNELCGFDYEQPVIINPYCPVNYELSEDGTYCQLVEETLATPPTDTEIAVAITSNGTNVFGSLIFDPGYNVDGVGTFTQISYANSWWVNGAGYPTIVGNTTDGPMNRGGIWSSSVFVGQQLGFSVCLDIPVDGTYYIGLSCDDKALIRIDGNTIVDQNRAALGAYLRANGYPSVLDSQVCIRFFCIYPVFLLAGLRVVEMIGLNAVGTSPGNAVMACEVYDLTSSAIQAATSYGSMGAGLLFSSKDKIGQAIEVGTDGIGYTCQTGYSLVTCSSPYVCRKVLTTPILY